MCPRRGSAGRQRDLEPARAEPFRPALPGPAPVAAVPSGEREGDRGWDGREAAFLWGRVTSSFLRLFLLPAAESGGPGSAPGTSQDRVREAPPRETRPPPAPPGWGGRKTGLG